MSGAICLACWGIYYAVLPRLGVVRHYKQHAAAGGGALELSPPSSIHLDNNQSHHVFTLGGDDDERPLVKRASGLASEHPHHHSNTSHDSRDHKVDGHASHSHHQHHTNSSVTSRTHSPQNKYNNSSPPRTDHDCIDHHQHVSNSSSSLLNGEPSTLLQSAAAVPAKFPGQRLAWQHVVAEAWHSALAMFLVYVITLSIFPGVLAEDMKVILWDHTICMLGVSRRTRL
eukprot:GHUV01021770.1.p1 GENE.GHUV01021770.1~~GHUV01021770.1.p1  ORF type:complete len:228 (+),score=55.27 GHUV01021770.1:336-1019(+)